MCLPLFTDNKNTNHICYLKLHHINFYNPLRPIKITCKCVLVKTNFLPDTILCPVTVAPPRRRHVEISNYPTNISL